MAATALSSTVLGILVDFAIGGRVGWVVAGVAGVVGLGSDIYDDTADKSKSQVNMPLSGPGLS